MISVDNNKKERIFTIKIETYLEELKTLSRKLKLKI